MDRWIGQSKKIDGSFYFKFIYQSHIFYEAGNLCKLSLNFVFNITKLIFIRCSSVLDFSKMKHLLLDAINTLKFPGETPS